MRNDRQLIDAIIAHRMEISFPNGDTVRCIAVDRNGLLQGAQMNLDGNLLHYATLAQTVSAMADLLESV